MRRPHSMSGYDMRPNAAALRREPDVEGPAELVGKPRFVTSGRLLARACFFSCVIALATVGLSVALRKEDAVSQGCDACTIPDSLTLRKDVLVPNVNAACQASTCSCKSPVLPTEVCGKPAFIVLVHVGKTGGSTIGAALAQANLDFWQIHGPDQVSHFTTSCHDKYTHYIFTVDPWLEPIPEQQSTARSVLTPSGPGRSTATPSRVPSQPSTGRAMIARESKTPAAICTPRCTTSASPPRTPLPRA